MPHIADLKHAFYGGGVDAQYQYFSNSGVTASGVTLPADGFSKFITSTRPHRHIVLAGDSIIQGDFPTPNGFGPIVRDIIRNRLTGVTVNYGFQGPWRISANSGIDGGVWTYGGTWAQADSTLANVSPVADVADIFGGISCPAGTGSTAIATWTKASGVVVNTVAFNYVDHTSIAGAANPSYSLDGGSTWVDLPLTRPADATLKRVVVPSAGDPATIRVRGADNAGTSSTMVLVGLEVYEDYDAGVTVHNVGRASSDLGSWVGNLFFPRKWFHWFSFIEPEAVLWMESNSTNTTYDDVWVPLNFDLLMDGNSTLGEPGFMSWGDLIVCAPPHQDTPTRAANWFAWRQAYQSKAAEHGAAFFDWSVRLGSYEDADAAGYMADELHLTTAGATRVAIPAAQLLLG